jgi:hypothetical protein
LVEWIFETQRIVTRGKIDDVVDDIVKLLEYPKGFPQGHLMSAGQMRMYGFDLHFSVAVRGRNPNGSELLIGLFPVQL